MSHGDGIVIRPATAADADALARFNADVHRHQDAADPNPAMGIWTGDLTSGRHPTTRVDDVLVALDTATREIVATVSLIDQTWTFDGIPFAMGQPELVGTREGYRGRGLVHRMFETVHAWSAARGHLLQAIDGIPGFYRLFGYAPALGLRVGPVVPAATLAALEPGPASLRPASLDDIPFLVMRDAGDAAQRGVTCPRDAATWRYELEGHHPESIYRPEVAIVTDATRADLGFIAHTPRVVGGGLWVVAWSGTPTNLRSVLPILHTTGTRFATRGDPGGYDRLGVWLGEADPAYAELPPWTLESDWVWHVRVPDLPAFVSHVRGALEARLATSASAGWTGALRLSLVTGGIALRFVDGQLEDVRPWQPPRDLHGLERFEPTTAERPDAMFPGETFLQLLFGYRSLDELQSSFRDCLVRTDAVGAVLRALFPKRSASVWAVL